MEEKVLYKVLCQIARGESPTAAPDDQYVNALITLGMIKGGWDMELTTLGVFIMRNLSNKLDPW